MGTVGPHSLPARGDLPIANMPPIDAEVFEAIEKALKEGPTIANHLTPPDEKEAPPTVKREFEQLIDDFAAELEGSSSMKTDTQTPIKETSTPTLENQADPMITEAIERALALARMIPTSQSLTHPQTPTTAAPTDKSIIAGSPTPKLSSNGQLESTDPSSSLFIESRSASTESIAKQKGFVFSTFAKALRNPGPFFKSLFSKDKTTTKTERPDHSNFEKVEDPNKKEPHQLQGMEKYRALESTLSELRNNPQMKLARDESGNFITVPRKESRLGTEGKSAESKDAVNALISELHSLFDDASVSASNVYQLIMKFRNVEWIRGVLENQSKIGKDFSTLVDKAFSEVEKQPVQMAQNFQTIGKNMENLFTAILSSAEFPITITTGDGPKTFTMEDVCLQIAGARKCNGAADVVARYNNQKDSKGLEERSNALDQLPLQLMPFAPKLPTYENYLAPLVDHLTKQFIAKNYPPTSEHTPEQQTKQQNEILAIKNKAKELLKGSDPGNTSLQISIVDEPLKAFSEQPQKSQSIPASERAKNQQLAIHIETKNLAAMRYIDPSIAYSQAKTAEELRETIKKMSVAGMVLVLAKHEFTASKDEKVALALQNFLQMAKDKGIELNAEEIKKEASEQFHALKEEAEKAVLERAQKE